MIKPSTKPNIDYIKFELESIMYIVRQRNSNSENNYELFSKLENKLSDILYYINQYD